MNQPACLQAHQDVAVSVCYRKDREGRFRDTQALDPDLAEVLDACMTDPFDVTGSR